MTESNVTKCTDNANTISEKDLSDHYRIDNNPRLNANQSLN
ncbi:3-deoxy-7-phosphoheptulonate synthase [Bartonella bilalgolemii]|uniref:Phospho-2-dehydro-3-deoxyheptonate aldolase n=1 Tax=Bartonella bilalgolemii TaxID=2942911 RepID=A0ABT0P827_9HYPH|nr:3-deoxy-7-phosphoheptulonate synthase [Bartonella sp. G70]MCL6229625.1 3-deoxy-7-phosphoheptulonate synthase [Bartonella sp. G70]